MTKSELTRLMQAALDAKRARDSYLYQSHAWREAHVDLSYAMSKIPNYMEIARILCEGEP